MKNKKNIFGRFKGIFALKGKVRKAVVIGMTAACHGEALEPRVLGYMGIAFRLPHMLRRGSA